MPKIFLAGDSTCAENGPETHPQAGWGQHLGSYLTPPWIVDNRAYNGRSTKSFLAEGRFASILDGLSFGDYVFIQFGHNDQKIEDQTRYAAPDGDYRNNLRFMVNEVQSRGVRAVLFSSISRRRFEVDGTLPDTLAPYPEVAKSVASELNVPFIDAHELTRAWLLALGDEGSRRFFMRLVPGEFSTYPEGCSDDTHLRHEGADAIARLIAKEGARLKLPMFLE